MGKYISLFKNLGTQDKDFKLISFFTNILSHNVYYQMCINKIRREKNIFSKVYLQL
jgi:hypothetical protein